MSDLTRPGKYSYLPVYTYTLASTQRDSHRDMPDGEAVTFGETGKRFSWWEEDSLMDYYPYIFINPVIVDPFTNESEEFSDDFLRWDRDKLFIVTDSGGFQMLSRPSGEVVDNPEETDWQKAKINPTRLAEWQTRNANVGITLDLPPYPFTSKEGAGEDEFRQMGVDGEVVVKTKDSADDSIGFDEWESEYFHPRKEKSVENAQEMFERWEEMGVVDDDDFYCAPPVHGQPTIDDRNQYSLVADWHRSIEEVGDWDGFALKPRPITATGSIVFFLSYAASEMKDYDYMHILQLGNLSGQILASYYSYLTGQWVTSDAGSWASATQWRSVEIPNPVDYDENDLALPTLTTRSVTITPRSDEEKEDDAQDATRFDMYPCRCSICHTVKEEKGIEYITEDESDSRRNLTLCFHNLHSILQTTRTAQSLLRAHYDTLLDDLTIKTKDKVKYYGNDFWHVMSSIFPDWKVISLYDGMAHIKYAYENGLDAADEKTEFEWYGEGGDWNGYKHNSGKSVL